MSGGYAMDAPCLCGHDYGSHEHVASSGRPDPCVERGCPCPRFRHFPVDPPPILNPLCECGHHLSEHGEQRRCAYCMCSYFAARPRQDREPGVQYCSCGHSIGNHYGVNSMTYGACKVVDCTCQHAMREFPDPRPSPTEKGDNLPHLASDRCVCGHQWGRHTRGDEGPCRGDEYARGGVQSGCGCPHFRSSTEGVPAMGNTNYTLSVSTQPAADGNVRAIITAYDNSVGSTRGLWESPETYADDEGGDSGEKKARRAGEQHLHDSLRTLFQ